jgi:transcriptional regulator with XRE-family HTH domain
MDLRQVFIHNLRSLRQKANLSQIELSLNCNMGLNYIGEIENGRKFPSVQLIQKIADVLQAPPHLLFWDDQNRHNKTRLRPRPIASDAFKKNMIEQLTTAIHKVIKEY